MQQDNFITKKEVANESKLPLVSIIAVNYNSISHSIDFVKSLKKLSYQNVELIFVDNNSIEYFEDEWLTSHFPRTKIIRSEENSGFAGGNNLGIRHAQGDYFLFLNNDTIVTPSLIEPLLNRLQKDKSIGMVCPKVLFHTPENEIELIQYAGAKEMHPITGRGYFIGNKEEDKGQYDKSHVTDLGMGCAMMVSKETIKSVGTMAEFYFMYYEEHDWAMQMKKNGLKIFYEASSKIYHKESASSGRNSPFTVYHLTRNRLLFIVMNRSKINQILGFVYFSLLTIPVNLLKYLYSGEFDLLKAFLRGIRGFLKIYTFNPEARTTFNRS